MTTNNKTMSEQETKTRVEVGKLEANEELTADELKEIKGGERSQVTNIRSQIDSATKDLEDNDRLGQFEIQ